MVITNNKTIKEIKEVFNTEFPGLKIEFYKEEHENYQGSEKATQYDENLTIGDINPTKSSGEITINETDITSNIEQMFEKTFGLHVQIFRRSKELWLQTSATDNWTIEVQNRKGIHSLQS